MPSPVVLVAMPWQILTLPSIQLGILQGVLERAGIEAESRSFYLAFMEHCRQRTADGGDEAIGVADYSAVANDHHPVGLGDWIFAVPPFREASDLDAKYLAYLRRWGLSDEEMARVAATRALVPSFVEECADELLALRPRVVGFTVTFNQAVPSLVLAKALKQRDPSIAVVFGGANCDGPMGAALHRAFSWVDVVVRGEAENVLPALVEELLAGEPVSPQPGLCYRDGERSVVVPLTAATQPAMDAIPTPIYTEYFERLARAAIAPEVADQVRLVYESARGCWWGERSHCAFCGLNAESMTFRGKSQDRVYDEIVTLAGRHRRLDFAMADKILDLRYFERVFPRLRDAGYDLNLLWEAKTNLKREQVRTLQEAGVQWLQLGIESLSTEILRLIGKGVTAFQNIRLLKWCAEHGLSTTWNFIYGFPGEPPEEYARMADLAPSLVHLPPPNLIPLMMERFSPYHEHSRELGLEILGPLPSYRYTYPVDDATLAELARSFEYRHIDGRDPETYVGPLRHAIDAWAAHAAAGSRALRYRRGPRFVVIHDRRPGLEPADYTFEETEARLYLACEDGATAEAAWTALGSADGPRPDLEEVKEFLDDLVKSRLAYEEGGHYLSLALPARLPEIA